MTRTLLLTPFAPDRAHDHAAADTLVRLVPLLAGRTELFVFSPQVAQDRAGDGYTLIGAGEQATPGLSHRFGVRPAWLRQAWSRRTAELAAAAIARLKPDVVHVEYLQGAEALAHARHTVLGLHDITEAVAAESFRVSHGPARAYRLAELVRTRRFERDAIRRAGAVITLSDADRVAASALNPHVVLARIGVDLPDVPWTSPVDGPPTLVFTGALWRRANELVALHLAENVLPLVWRTHPDARLRLAGARPGPRLTALAEADERIVVTGAVPDLRDEMRAAHAILAPSIIGGGVLLKVLHAMSLGAPVITSPGPAESAGADSSMVYVGDSAEELADAVGAVLADPAAAAKRGALARQHIGERFRWSDTVDSYLEAYAMASAR